MSYPANVNDENGVAVSTVQIVSEETNYDGKGTSLFTADDDSQYVADLAHGAGLLPAP